MTRGYLVSGFTVVNTPVTRGKRGKEKTAGCLGHGGNGGRAQLNRGFRVSSGKGDRAVGGNESKKESRNICPRLPCVGGGLRGMSLKYG